MSRTDDIHCWSPNPATDRQDVQDRPALPARWTPDGYIRDMTTFHDLEMTSITGEQVSFDQYKGHLALVVNVASN